MPQIIPFVVTAITAVTSAVVAAGPLAVAAFNAANIIGAGLLANEAFKAVQPQVKSSSTAIEWNADPNAPNRFAFGRVGGAGNIIHNATYGPDKMFVGFVGVMSASGPIKSWQAFKADDAFVAFDGAGKAINTDYANVMWLNRQRGAQPETSYLPSPSGLKDGAAMPRWGSSYKLSGKAAYHYTLAENSKRSAYKGKVPTGIHTIEGVFCYDPRFDSTYPGGSGPCRLNDPTTWLYSTNAYIHALNWNIGRWEGEARGSTPKRYGVPYASMKVGGIGAQPEGIDFSAYVEAANVFDENRWSCAAWPDADQGKGAVLDSFLQAGGGIYAERQGKVSCLHRAAPRASIVTITADDTAGTIEYDTTTSLLERINTIRPEYWSETHGWQMVATDEVTSAVWREEDGQGVEVTRSKGLAYNYVPQSKQARELAALQIAHTREGIRGTAPLRHYLDLDVGDCFTFEVPEAVLNGQKCIVLNVDPDLENDIINVTFASESDGKYPFAFGQADAPPPAPGLQPADNTVSPPLPEDWTIIVRPPASGGTQLPGFDLTGIVSNSTATAIIVEYGPTPDGPWKQVYQGPPTVETIPIDGLQPGQVYYVAVQYQRNQNYSDRYIYGPETAPGLVAEDTTHVGGTPASEITDRLQSVESVAAATQQGVADLELVFGDTVSAAESALAAGEAANLAVLKAGDASAAAAASNVSAGIATTKADEAGNSATAANAAKVAAEAARDTAGGSATASATSAAHAAASATTAGEKATASDASATQAATRAGEALTYRNQASSSAADAAAAAVTASTASGTAVTARDVAIGARNDAQAAAATSIAQSSSASASAAAALISADLAARVGSLANMLPNSTAKADLKGWSGGPWVRGSAPGYGTWFQCSAAGDQYWLSENIPAIAGREYTVSFSADTGGGLAAVFVTAMNGDTGIQDYLGILYYTSADWDERRVCPSFVLPAGANAIRVVLYKAAAAPYAAVSKIMVNRGPTAINWNDFAQDAAVEASLNITAAVAADAQTRLSSARFEVIAAAGSDPAQLLIRADGTGSLAGLVATEISFANVVGGVVVKAMKLIGGEVFFMRPIYIDVGANRLIVGPGGTWVLWFGSTDKTAATATRTNGVFCLGTDGKVYYGSSELSGGARSGGRTFQSGAGGASAETVIDGIAAGSFIEMTGSIDGGSLIANTALNGRISLLEVNGSGSRQVYAEDVVVASSGLQRPNGSWSAEGASVASIRVPAAKTGSVTYRVQFTRLSGSTYVDGAVLSGSVFITPPA